MLKPCGAALAFLVATILVGCGNSAAPATPTTSPPTPTAAASPPDPETVGENPAKPRARKPFPIHSSCSEVVTIVFGEDPKAAGADKRTVASNSSVDGPRDAEGKQTVHLLDDKGESIAKVHMNRGMKQLEIGRSCRTLDAH
jgi:hypothetical protein